MPLRADHVTRLAERETCLVPATKPTRVGPIAVPGGVSLPLVAGSSLTGETRAERLALSHAGRSLPAPVVRSAPWPASAAAPC